MSDATKQSETLVKLVKKLDELGVEVLEASFSNITENFKLTVDVYALEKLEANPETS